MPRRRLSFRRGFRSVVCLDPTRPFVAGRVVASDGYNMARDWSAIGRDFHQAAIELPAEKPE
jgi:hypothetical protein